MRALKTDLDDLDDDDLVLIGRAVTGLSPRRAFRVLSMFGATLAAPFIAYFAGAESLAIVAVVFGAAVVGLVNGRADARRDLADAGLADELADEVAGVATSLIRSVGADEPPALWPGRKLMRARGAHVVASVRSQRNEASE